MKEAAVETDGVVLDRNSVRVALANGHEIRATVAARMRRNRIKVMVNDWVLIEMSPYDLSKVADAVNIARRGEQRRDEERLKSTVGRRGWTAIGQARTRAGID
jgi:translation initiation factor IF-1